MFSRVDKEDNPRVIVHGAVVTHNVMGDGRQGGGIRVRLKARLACFSDRVTSELNTSEDWNLILDICDRAKQSMPAVKDCLRSINRRLKDRVPHVAIQALSLLGVCVKNCGHIFHLEIASKDFVDECKGLLSDKTHPKVAQNLRLLIKAWAEGDFKTDPSLALIPAFYNTLKAEGHSFVSDEVPKSAIVLSKDPNVVQSQEEQDDIAKAIALSLKDAEKHLKTTKFVQQTSSTLYPAFTSAAVSSAAAQKSKEPKKVRALYDFEAVEDNELTFKAGEVIGVIDDSDPNWWKGTSWRGEGLFPANFVSPDLGGVEAAPPNESVPQEVAPPPVEAPTNVIDEEQINVTLELLQNADPTGEVSHDPQELAQLEDQCRCMAPLINQELERIDRQHMRLMDINSELMSALQMYHGLMRELPAYGYAPPPLSLPPQLGAGGISVPGGPLPPGVMYAGGQWVGQPALQGGPPAYASLSQIMNAQQSLSVTQIPQGIAAQVGPAPPSSNQNQAPQQQQMLQQQQFSHASQQFGLTHQQQGGPPLHQQSGPVQFGYTPQQQQQLGPVQHYSEGVQQYAQHNGQGVGGVQYSSLPAGYSLPSQGNISPPQQLAAMQQPIYTPQRL